VHNTLVARLGCVLTGAYLLASATTTWTRGQIHVHHEVIALISVTYLLGFGLLLLAVSDCRRIEKYSILIFLALILSCVFSTYVIVHLLSTSYGGDPLVFNHYSASLVLKGQNPYVHSMAPGYSELGVAEHVISPTLSGGVIDNFTYPALSFLLYVPFLWAGVTDIRWISLLFYIAAYSLIYFKSPKPLRPVILLPLFIIPSILDNIGGNDDMVWVVFLIPMALYMTNTRLSGLFYGIACAFKQTPLILAPFLLIWIWKSNESMDRKHRLLKLVEFSAISGATFVAFNLPFIIADAHAWCVGVLAPFTAATVPHGSGLSMLSQVGLLDLPKSFYTIATVLVTLTLLEIYFVYFQKIRYAIWLFPAIIFWFAYRSLDNYFIFWIPLLLISFSIWYADSAIPIEKRVPCESTIEGE
jgi:uncharacterized membrane protein